MVANPAKPHYSWPDGWRLETTPEGTGHLIQKGAERAPVQNA
ncbi:hypothetical protein J2S55_007753 [Streptosporangium brasiliense]|uniref:Uncharacterized protein n=1 Tax=Streptosporangium brasiliense TaxID=47480 RepID=A0ABT9RGU0_9ACTN|nr:hypothetical protein [Streptosporangium brasiliense]